MSTASDLPVAISDNDTQQNVDSPASYFANVRPQKPLAFPDPSQFPDPYPFRPPHHHLVSTPPVLSSGESSTASTRSSAYTSSSGALRSSDYGSEVYVATGEEDVQVGVGITSDDIVQLLTRDGDASMLPLGSRMPIDPLRWSEGYSLRRSHPNPHDIVTTNGLRENDAPNMSRKASFDATWSGADERHEPPAVSDEETDEGQSLEDLERDNTELAHRYEERTTAMVVAEEGRGVIVRGEGVPLIQLPVRPGTTHLLLGSSVTPNVLPSFLSNIVPDISSTLLALDISANFLHALPPCLAACTSLEELNIASNPLRVIPVFLSQLTALRVLIADSTGITTLPFVLGSLGKLHTLSIRRNKMHSLPTWLCLLPSLQTLQVDHNPFQGPWKALVEPLLADNLVKSPSVQSPASNIADNAPRPVNEVDVQSNQRKEEFPETYLDEFAVKSGKSTPVHASSNMPESSHSPPRPTLVRTRTAPGRAYNHRLREGNRSLSSVISRGALSSRTTTSQAFGNEPQPQLGRFGIRKMRSAGDLKASPPAPIAPPPHSAAAAGDRGFRPVPMTMAPPGSSRSAPGSGFQGRTPEMPQDRSRPLHTSRQSVAATAFDSPPSSSATERRFTSGGAEQPSLRSQMREAKEKIIKWGFLRKMSMGKIKIDSSTSSRTSPQNLPSNPSNTSAATSHDNTSARLDARFPASATGVPDTIASPDASGPSSAPLPATPSPTQSPDALVSPSLSAPTSSPTKRRSFLPLDRAPVADRPTFDEAATASHRSDESVSPQSSSVPTSSPVEGVVKGQGNPGDALESYGRALRSVMAYLRDMNDLVSNNPPVPSPRIPSYEDQAGSTLHSRRPTLGAIDTMSEVPTVNGSAPGLPRQAESVPSSRTSSQTFSVATSTSNDSGGDRRLNDKGKRAMVVREIVETERTYVKGLQELVDIYVKAASAPVNSLTSATSKETVVPVVERKIVFGSIDPLFSFHKDSFLPALEAAAAPILTSATALQEADADGQLSLNVAKAVGGTFVRHAAFMKMYSTYINNFENSVQRVKAWTSDHRPTTSASSPQPSNAAQLAGLGLALSGIAGTVGEAAGHAFLTSSQRKRIKSYLKRCRMNPRHCQLNLEGYLLLPVQRIPRYRLLLEELLRSTLPTQDLVDDPIERALEEISLLANKMNEGKRESESRRKLVQWQTRIRGRFPSPLVQPHRRLIMDGPLLLTRVVRKTVITFDTINAQGDTSTVQVDCLAPELTPRSLVGILCNDLLVLCRDPSQGQDPNCHVDLWAVLRMQTLPQPASIVHGNVLRLVDNKAILYFDVPSQSDAVNWHRAINLHIPASKS